jgi:hypothetical protein
MKIEFVKDTKQDGEVTYHTRVDGYYISNSLSFDENKARELFERIKKDGPHALEDKREIIEIIEIESNEKK